MHHMLGGEKMHIKNVLRKVKIETVPDQSLK